MRLLVQQHNGLEQQRTVREQLPRQQEQTLEMKKNPWELSRPQMNPQGKRLAEKNQEKSLEGKNREKSLERCLEKSPVGMNPVETIHQVMSRLPEMLENLSQSHQMALYRRESERQEPMLGR